MELNKQGVFDQAVSTSTVQEGGSSEEEKKHTSPIPSA
jgi:hypothetical protein